MRRRKLLQAFCLALLVAAVLMTQASLVQAAAEECRARPDLSGQMGNGHWHYRIDRISQRRCWFLSSGDSRMQHIGSLRRRELSNRNTPPGIEEQSTLDEKTSPGSPPIQEPVVLSDQPMHGELAAPDFDAQTSESLVPHKVTLVSVVQPRASEQTWGVEPILTGSFFAVYSQRRCCSPEELSR